MYWPQQYRFCLCVRFFSTFEWFDKSICRNYLGSKEHGVWSNAAKKTNISENIDGVTVSEMNLEPNSPKAEKYSLFRRRVSVLIIYTVKRIVGDYFIGMSIWCFVDSSLLPFLSWNNGRAHLKCLAPPTISLYMDKTSAHPRIDYKLTSNKQWLRVGGS